MPADVYFSAQKKVKTKKKSSLYPQTSIYLLKKKKKEKIITSAGRSLRCNFPKFFVGE